MGKGTATAEKFERVDELIHKAINEWNRGEPNKGEPNKAAYNDCLHKERINVKKQLKFLFVAFLLLTAGVIAHTVQAYTTNSSNVYAVYNNGTLTFIQATGTPTLNSDNISVKSTNGNTYTGRIYKADGSWSSLNSQIKTVNLTTKVTPQNTNHWFAGCTNLTSVNNAQLFDMSNNTNMTGMFQDCSNLTNLNVSNWNTGNVTNMSWIFQNCHNLANLDVSKWNTSKVTDISGMFYGCSSLSNLDVSKWDTSKVTNMYLMFHGCSRLSNLDVSKWNTGNVTNMSWMFQDCSSLTNLNVSSWDTSKVTNSDGMFSGTTKLQSLTLGSKFNINSTKTGLIDNFDQRDPSLYPKWVRTSDDMIKSSNDLMTMNANNRVGTWEAKKSNVYAVYNNGTLTFIQSTDTPTLNTDNISVKSTNGNTYTGRIYKADGSWNSLNSQITTVNLTTKVTPLSTSNWFSGCTNLTSVNNAQLFDMSNNTNMSWMFQDCQNLNNLDVSNWDTSKVTDMSILFQGCSSLTNLDVSKWNTGNVTNMIGMFQNCSSLTRVGDLSNWNTSKVTDMSSMFDACSSLASVGDLSNWNTSQVTDMSWMFTNCSKLTNLDVSNWDTSKVTDMGLMFQSCQNLSNLDVSKWNTGKVTDMTGIFQGCSSLARVGDLSKWDTSQVTDMTGMFQGCSNLSSVGNLSNWNTSQVTNMNWMFQDCSNLSSVGNLSKWDTSKVTNMNEMFTNCSKLTNLDVSNWDTSKVTDMGLMFNNCQNLSNLDISKWNTSQVTNMVWMFSGDSSLTNLDASKWNTGNVTDMSYMFYGCSNLVSVGDLSNWDTSKVTGMSWMFQDCSSLTNLNVSNWDTGKVTTSDDMFSGTTKLQSLTLGSKFNINSTNTGLSDNFDQRDPSLYPKWVRTSDDMIKSSNELMTMDASVRVGTWEARKSHVYAVYNNGTLTFIQTTDTPSFNTDNVSVKSTNGNTYTGRIYEADGSWSSLNSQIKTVNLTTKVTPLSTNHWFNGCTNLTSVNNAQLFDMSNNTDMTGMFQDCSNLSNLDVSNWNTSNVTNMGWIFQNCHNLSNLDVSKWNTSKVTDISGMFYGCSSLTNLDVSKWDTSKVTNMFLMFSGCSSLTNLDVSKWNTGSVTNMSWMFQNCSSLSNLDVSNWDTSKVTASDGMFSGTTKLQSLTLGSKFNINSTNTGLTDNFDQRDPRLYPKWVRTSDNMIKSSNDLMTMDASARVGTWATAKKSHVYAVYSNGTLTFIQTTDTPTLNTDNISVKSTNGNTYTGRIYEADGSWHSLNSQIKTVNLTTKVTPLSTDNWFAGCTNLTSVNNAQLFDMSNNTDMRWMFQNCQSLTNLDVSNWNTGNVTNMSGIFGGCSSLTNLDVSKWDTGKVTAMIRAFQGCSNLSNLDVSNWDTSKVTNMVSMFSGCSSLTNLDVSKWDTSKVTDMSWMFLGCSSLANLDVSNWNTSNVTGMNYMFYNCSSLTNLDVLKWNTGNATDISGMFYDCSNLANLDVSKWDTGKVTDMSFMFANCSSLTNLDVSKWDTGNATSMGYMFSGCSGLTNLDVSKWDTGNTTNMHFMFDGCSSLANLNMSKWDTSKVTYSDGMFSGTTKLQSLTLGSKFNINSTNTGLTDNFDQRDPSLYPKWVRTSDDMIKSSNDLMTMDASARVGTWTAKKSHVYAVYNNGTLTFIQTTDTPSLNTDNISVKSTNGNTYTGKIYEADGSWSSLNSQIKTVNLTTKVTPLSTNGWFSGCTNLTSVNNAQLFDMSNNTDMTGMFNGCSNLTNLDVSNWDTSKVTDMNSMFQNCSSLTNLDVSKWDTSNVTNMRWIFANCSSLTNLDVSNWNTSRATRVDGMFHGCSSLTNLDVSKWNTSNVTDMGFMFQSCQNLTNLDVSKWDTSKVTDMGWMFNYCSSLTNLDVSNWDTSKVTTMNSTFACSPKLTNLDVSKWDTSNVTNMRWMFQNCSSLTNLDVSKWDTSNVTDMGWMFQNCSSLANLDMSKWDTSKVTDMSGMFQNCSSLSNLDVSKWDTSNVTDMIVMFQNCQNLTNLDVSKWNTGKVTDMSWMFNYCSNLISVGDLSNWDTSQVTTMNSTFACSPKLTNLDVSKWDTSNVTNMRWMFQNCSSLTNLDVSKWDTSNVTDMGYMFQNCSGLASLDVSNWDTSKVTSSDYMFTGTTKLQSLTLGSKFNINSTNTGLADDFNKRDPSLYSKWVRTSDDMVKSSNDLMTMDASARVGTWTAKKMIATIDITDSNKKTVLESATLDNYKTIVDKWAHRGYTVGTSNVPPALDPYAPSYKMTYTVYMNPNVSTYSVSTTTPKGTYMFKDGKQVGTKTVNLTIIMNGGAYFTSNKMSNVINQVMSQTPAGWNVESTKYTITDGYGNNQTTPQGGYTVVYSVEFAVDQDKVTKNYGEFAPVLPADHDSYDAISGGSIKIVLPDVYTVTSLATRTSPYNSMGSAQDTVYAFYKLTAVRTGNYSTLGNLTFTDGKTGGYVLLDGKSSGNYVTAHIPIDWSNANNAGSYKWYESHMSFEYVNNYDNPDMAVVDTDDHMFDVTWYKHNPILFDDTNPSEQQVPYCQLNILGNDGKSFDTITLHNTYNFLQNSTDYLTAKAGYGIEYPYQVMQQFYDESANANNKEPSGYATTSNLYDNTLTSDINHEELRFYTSSKQLHDVPANTSNEFAQLNAQYGSVFYPMQFQTLTNITARSKLLRNGFQAYADSDYDNKSLFNSPSNAVSSMMLGNNRYDPDHRHCDYIKDNVKEGIYPLNINANIGEVTVNKNFKIQIYGSRMASKGSSDGADGEISIDGTLSGTTSTTTDNLKNQHGITDEEAEQLKDFLKN